MSSQKILSDDLDLHGLRDKGTKMDLTFSEDIEDMMGQDSVDAGGLAGV